MQRPCALLAVLALSCSASSPGKRVEKKQSLTLLVTAEMRGTIEPCGCNSDPLGDIARTTELVTSLRAQGRTVLVLDGGSLLYTQTSVPEHLMAQASLKSDLISDLFQNRLKATAIGLGPYDFGAGIGKVRPARQAANVDPQSGVPIEPPKLIRVGDVQIGVFGVVSPDALSAVGVTASDPVAAARKAVADLRAQGARLVVGLAHMTDTDSKRLAKAVPGIDILVAAQNAPEPHDIKDDPAKVGSTYVVTPANRGQIITRFDITLRDQSGPLIDAIGEVRAASEVTRLGQQIATLETQLATWKNDPTADASFVSKQEALLAELRAKRASLKASPVQIPSEGSYFTMAQVPIRKSLACHAEVQRAKQAFDKQAGAANVKAAKGRKPADPADGKAGYIGVEACSECHDEQVAFWQTTHHANAWKTLTDVGKEFDYECIGCHVTGWERPGGANLGYNDNLRSIQCEVCHGPGSLHADEGGDAELIQRTPPESLCKDCHNKEHSDTFQFQAYLRDVTGEGHAPDFRSQLGDGATGLELRSAALEKAGKTKGAGCLK